MHKNWKPLCYTLIGKFCSFPTKVATLSADRFGVLKLFAETASLIHRWSEALHEKTVEDC